MFKNKIQVNCFKSAKGEHLTGKNDDFYANLFCLNSMYFNTVSEVRSCVYFLRHLFYDALILILKKRAHIQEMSSALVNDFFNFQELLQRAQSKIPYVVTFPNY